MKKLKLCSVFLLLILKTFANSHDTITAVATIEKIKVYLANAEVISKKDVNLKIGQNVVLFDELSTKINAATIRVSADNDVSILNVMYRINQNYKTATGDTKKYTDSIELLNKEITLLLNRKTAYETESKLLSQNMNFGGTTDGVNFADLKLAAEFYRTRTLEIANALSEINEKTLLKRTEIATLNAKVALLYPKSKPHGQIAVLVYSDKNQTISFKTQYMVNDAGWTPAYDIKVKDLTKPISLVYSANVYNNTDIEWKNVSLVLSTADPNVSAIKPVQNPWYLNFEVVTNYNKANDYQQQSNQDEYEKLDITGGEGRSQNMYVPSTEVKKEEKVEYTEIEITNLNAEFVLDIKYTIPSDNQPYLVELAKHELTAKFEHYAASKLIKDVFLLAKITGWEKLDLVDGSANIFFDGTYIGESYITTRNVEDTLDLSLGIDDKVLVTRTKVKEFSNKKIIGNKVTETFVFELVAKNNRSSAIDIEILDQIPISQNSEIEVEVIEISKIKQDPLTGEVKWKLKLEPGSSEKLKISYSIKYPKNKIVKSEQVQTRKVRKF